MITLLTSFHKAKFQGSEVQESIINHLKRLNKEDRYTRFFVSYTDEQIERYVERIDLSHDFIFYNTDENGDVDGVLHAARGDDGEMDFGISVDESIRGKGVGANLFQAAMSLVHMLGCRKIYVNCLVMNKAMNAIARKFCDSVERVDVDTMQGAVKLPDTGIKFVNYTIGGILVADSTFKEKK